MDAQKVDMFIMTNGSNLPEQKVPFIREKLLSLDDSKWAALSTIQFKNPTTALLLSIFLGAYGIDRFYIGNTGMGVGKLLTCGGLGIWAIIDWFMISGSTKEQNYNKLQAYLYYTSPSTLSIGLHYCLPLADFCKRGANDNNRLSL